MRKNRLAAMAIGVVTASALVIGMAAAAAAAGTAVAGTAADDMERKEINKILAAMYSASAAGSTAVSPSRP